MVQMAYIPSYMFISQDHGLYTMSTDRIPWVRIVNHEYGL